jgi:Domain of unknown function (DUF4431)
MMRRLIVLGVAIAALSPHALAAQCLGYEAVSLAGTLVRQTYPGPPDFESLSRGDKPIVVPILLLDRPVCVVDPASRYPRRYNQREIELVLDADLLDTYRALLGKKVIVSGTLMDGGAKHDKPLVLAAIDIARVSERPYG